MKKFAKIALGALMLAGAATAMTAAPADARVSVGIGIGVPGYYGGPAYYPRYSCDPYSRFYDPYYCGAYARPYYYGPDFYLNYHTGWGGGFRDFDRGHFGGGGFHGGNGGFHGGGSFHGGSGGTGGHSGGHH
jgi:hypothetical protein